MSRSSRLGWTNASGLEANGTLPISDDPRLYFLLRFSLGQYGQLVSLKKRKDSCVSSLELTVIVLCRANASKSTSR